MLTTFSVDWTKSVHHMIDAGSGYLPENIRAFEANEITPEVLRHAVDLFKAPTQVVQIQTPQSRQLIKDARLLESIDGREEAAFTDEDLQELDESLHRYFQEIAGDTLGRESFLRLERSFCDMVTSVRQNWGSGSINEFIILRESTVQYPTYGFHSHVCDDKLTPKGRKAFFFTRPLSDVSTVFVDRNDLDHYSHDANAVEAHFINPQPDLWFAMPGSYLLFATKGHEQGPAFHSSPINEEDRTIPIVNFYI